MKKTFKFITVFIAILSMLIPTFSAAAVFTDVPEGKWYSEAVDYVTEKGYFSGMSATTFEPKTDMSRAMFVTMLAAISGEDISSYTAEKFNDVRADSWYNSAVGWANENGIVNGTSDTSFSPKSPINRQEVCVMLCKYIEYRGYYLSNEIEYTEVSDHNSISEWAKDSVYEIKGYGIVTGKDNNMFDPKGTATRAEVAQMIMKLDMAIENQFDLYIDEIDITINGVTDPVKIFHVSDTHITLTDEEDPAAAVTYQNSRGSLFAGEITDGVSSVERFDQYFKYAEVNDVDLIALTGDIIDAPSSGNLNYFKTALNNTTVDHLYSFGNHDWTATWLDGQLGGYQSQAQWNLNVPKFYDGIITSGEEKIAVRKFDGFTVIAVDNSNNQIDAAQYAILFNYLQGDTPIILMMHVPMYLDTMVEDVSSMWGSPILMGSPTTNPNNYTQMFCAMLNEKNSPVVAILAGHVHMDHVDDVSPNNDTVQYTLGASYKGFARLFNIHG